MLRAIPSGSGIGVRVHGALVRLMILDEGITEMRFDISGCWIRQC